MDIENKWNHSISPTTQTPTSPPMTTKTDGARMKPLCCVSPKTMATWAHAAAGGLSGQSETRARHRPSASPRCGSAREADGGFS